MIVNLRELFLLFKAYQIQPFPMRADWGPNVISGPDDSPPDLTRQDCSPPDFCPLGLYAINHPLFILFLTI